MDRVIEFIGNNLFWITIWFAVLLLLVWNLFSDLFMGITTIGPQDLTRRINSEGAVVVDIRGQTDFESGHILSAINISEKDLPQRKKELQKFIKKPIVVVCQSGNLSAPVVRMLKSEGFEDVSSLKGGLATWQRASLPLSRSK
jgi:rhodanese-related sulfurtransferase